jgi:hypothetical protein
MPPMRPDLLALFDPDELAKYYTEEELVEVRGTQEGRA